MQHSHSVKVSSFFDTGRSALEMEVAAGEKALGRAIPEAAINRPGLALTGFYEHFAKHRIQVLGLSECSYLLSLDAEARRTKLTDFFARRMPCVVLARHRRVFPEMVELATTYSVPVLRTRMITKHFVNAATILMENLVAPRQKAQGTMVEIMGIGVLIEGKPGMGKSEIALALIQKGHALVADDITALRLDSAGAVIGSAVDVTRYHMEIRGVGIIHVPSLFGVSSVRGEKKLDLVVTLCEPDRLKQETVDSVHTRTRSYFGVKIPQMLIPVAPGRDLSNVVETAALDQKLRTLGHDAEKELDDRLIASMSAGRNGSE